MRVIYSLRFDVTKVIDELEIYSKHLDKFWNISLTRNMMALLDSGLYYIHGRDRSLRPIVVFTPEIALKIKANVQDAVVASHFVNNYILKYLLWEEKIETWSGIMDLSNLSFTSLPLAWIKDFIKAFMHTSHCRMHKGYMLNTTWGFRMVWKIVNIFSEVANAKLTVEGK